MTTLERDGTKLACFDGGGGGEAVVLVHGWCCDRSFFAPQAEHLAKAGRRVVAPDLRGHTARAMRPTSPTRSAFSPTTSPGVHRKARPRKPVIVGHSMGGIVAFDLAARYPDMPGAIVMLDSSVARSQAARTAAGGLCKRLAGPDRVEVMRDYVSTTLFIPTDDPVRKERLLERMCSAPAHVVVSAMEGFNFKDGGAEI
ncbi:MAG: alpha/beta hydrolase [Asticcacaulis sp.]|nr:alpha/beta hydrolase [Asticcacaulis sp.]